MAPSLDENQKDSVRRRVPNEETPESFGLTLSAIQVSRVPAPRGAREAGTSRRYVKAAVPKPGR